METEMNQNELNISFPNTDNQSSPEINVTELLLGDIIELVSPTNPDYHETTNYITYVDNSQIYLTNVATLREFQLNIIDNRFTDESIIAVNLLDRSDEKGYARQNNLLPNTWIDIHFGGEIPIIVTGQISNLEEDMIEIITYPTVDKTIYIDFEYKGIPLNLPVEKFVIREKPASLKSNTSLSLLKDDTLSSEDSPETDASIEFIDDGESVVKVSEDEKPDPNIHSVLNDLYTEANTITFGEKLEDIPQLVEIPESEIKYSIESQVTDMMDELLSTIPNSQRTKSVLNNIHTLIERYVGLREQFSEFDNNNDIIDRKVNGEYYKPVVDKLYNLNYKLSWIIPIVSYRKKINIDENQVSEQSSDVVSENMTEKFSSIFDMKSKLYKKGSNDNAISYDYIQNKEKNNYRPFENAFNINDCLTVKNVQENIDAVVDNLNDFYSSVYDNSLIKKTRYVIQRYNLGENKLTENVMKSGKKIYSLTENTKNDEMCVKSFLTLPKSAIQFSEIHLPTSNILTKTQLHRNYLLLFKLLNKKTDVSNFVIDDFSKMLDYEQIENETKQSIFNGINEFTINTDIQESMESIDNNQKYRQFLEAIIPYTRTLIKSYKKYIKNAMSLVKVVKKMEPFSVYTDNIEYGQYMEIRYFIKEQIAQLKERLATEYNKQSSLKNAQYNVNINPNTLLRILSENNSDFADTFFKHYHFLENDKLNTQLTPSEILHKMMATDNMQLYSTVVTSILIELNSPDNIIATVQNSVESMDEEEKIKSEECGTKYLAKKYHSITELQKDNEKEELYFDEKYDDTPYHIMDKYKNQQKEMPSDLFFSFIVENLVQIHNVLPEKSRELAQTLISKKKLIQDNHYALVEILPKPNKDTNIDTLSEKEKDSMEIEANIRKKVYYYRRLKDNWVKADDISEESFFDNNTLFCNLSSNNCLKNSKNMLCESNEQIKIRIKSENKDALQKEFTNRYEITLEELEKKINQKLSAHLKNMRKNNILNEINNHRANNLHYEIGKTYNNEDILLSPHLKLIGLIMGQDDFAKKQADICKFVDKFSRDSNKDLNEDPNWFYCIDTNTKLFPCSIYKLANAYVLGENYQLVLEQICADVGTLSDDGEAIVDKHSGYVLKKMDLSTEEGYDEIGRKLQTRDIMEKELGAVLEDTQNKKKRIFENSTAEMIYNVSKSICNNIGIPFEDIEDKILRHVNSILDKNLLNEAGYKRRSEMNFKKTGKYLGSYDKYKNETILTIIGSVIHICIQTQTPSFKSKKSFPNCVRSFSGYPLTGIEDVTGINYIACVLIKMKSSISPWDAMKGMKQEKFSNRIKEVIDKFIMPLAEVQDLYVLKKNYIKENPELVPPEEHKLEKWVHCLPPIINFKVVNTIKNVSTDFKKDMVEKMKKGDPRQHISMNVIKSKQVQNGYGIIETINNSVKNKDTLLKTVSGIPFLENACCNEDNSKINPISYFANEDPNIKVLIQRTLKNEKTMSDIHKLSNARMFNFTEKTFVEYPELSSDYLEENIYLAFIHYCNFDKDLPIPNKLMSVCTSFPEGYNPKWNIQEKMEFLKRNGKRFTINQLQQLMTIIRKDNIVSSFRKQNTSQLDTLKDLIDTFELNDSQLFEDNLRSKLRDLLNVYDQKIMQDTASPELENLTNYLITVNNNLYKQIMRFFDKNGDTISVKEYNNIGNYLLFINKWNLEKDVELHTIGNYMQTVILNICKLYPTLLLNEADFYKNVCKHWGFSDNHENDISRFINKYGKVIEKFKGDKVIVNLLKTMSIKLIDMNLFIQNIPKQSEIIKTVKDENDKDIDIHFHSLFDKLTFFELLKYCLYKTLYEFMYSSEDEELLRTEVKSIRDNAIEQNLELNSLSNNIGTSRISVTEEYEDAMEELEETDIVMDTQQELKSRVSNLLYSFLEIEMENKEVVNYSYQDIMKKVNRSKEREKKAIFDYLGNMSKEERKVEELFKTFKLGRWNVGQQKGLVSYDKNTYERERNELLAQLGDDELANKYDAVSEMRREIFDLDKEQDDDAEEFYDNEANDISQLDEDYQDGVYYEEDREEEDI